MGTGGSQDGEWGGIFILVVFAVACVIAVIGRRRRQPDHIHRRGTHLLTQEEAQSRASGKGGTG
jgi:hypothetical protein